MTVETVGAILVDNGRVLLGRRAGHKTFAGCWDVIGGHVEPGETIDAALHRELSEELGITGSSATYIETLVIGDGNGSSVPLHLFAIPGWRGTPGVRNDEHDELRWFDLAEAAVLHPLVTDDYRRVLASLRIPRG